MTNFVPTALDAGGAGFDFFGSGGNYIAYQQQPSGNSLSIQKVADGIYRGDLTIRTLDGGMDMPVAHLYPNGPVPSAVSVSYLDHRKPDTLALLSLTRQEATGVFGSTSDASGRGFSVAYLPEERRDIIVGAGETSNKSLYTISQNGNGFTFTAQTYSPGSGTGVISLAAAVIGGVAQPERLIVGRASTGAAQVLTDIDGTPTTSGTMHSTTAECYGTIVTPLNASTPGASTLLMLCNTTLYALSSTAAIGDAPTAVLTNLPAGGWALGFFPLRGYPPRAYWALPYEDDGGTYYRVLSTNAEGDDAQFVDIPLDRIIDVKHHPNRGGLVATDGAQAVWITGSEKINPAWFSGRPSPSAVSVRLHTVECVDNRFLFGVEHVAQTGSTDNVNPAYVEEWIPETNAWQTVMVQAAYATTYNVGPFRRSIRLTPSWQNFDTGAATHMGAVFFYVHYNDGGVTVVDYWRYVNIFPPTWNSYYAQGDVNSSPAISYQFETGGYLKSPIYHIVGFEGYPKVAADCWFGGELPTTTGTTSKVQIGVAVQDKSSMKFTGDTMSSGVTAAGPVFTFNETDRWENLYTANPDNQDAFDRLQFLVSVTRAAGSNDEQASPQALPFKIGFYIFTQGPPMSPRQADPKRYERWTD